MSSLSDVDRAALEDLAPLARRAIALDAHAVARIRVRDGTATLLVRLPFGVLVSRSVPSPEQDAQPTLDATVGAAALLQWLDAASEDEPARRDAEWRAGTPPADGWQRLDSVPDDVIRPLVRAGARTLKAVAEREGMVGGELRAEVSDALLDAVVLTITDDAGPAAELTLRAVSALTRMGFLPRGSSAHVDIRGRWVRLVGQYGTVYLERPSGLTLR